MKQWLSDYIKGQKSAHDSIPLDAVAQVIDKLRVALKEDGKSSRLATAVAPPILPISRLTWVKGLRIKSASDFECFR